MANNSLNISPPYKFEIKTPPRGMTDYDPAALHPDQQEQLNVFKMNLMRENMQYLSKKPETKAIFCWLGRFLWDTDPINVLDAMGKRFLVPEKIIRKELKEILTADALGIEDQLAESDVDDWDY